MKPVRAPLERGRVTDRTLAARYFPNVSVRAFYAPHSLAVFMPTDERDEARRDDPVYHGDWLKQRLPVTRY